MKHTTFKRCIIIGGGASIDELLGRGLRKAIRDEIIFGTNYSSGDFNTTVAFFYDLDFYFNEMPTLARMPLVITKQDPRLQQYYELLKNLRTIKVNQEYNQTGNLKDGVSKGNLTGTFALNCAVAMGFEEIYLLGFDFCDVKDNQKTHYYQPDPSVDLSRMCAPYYQKVPQGLKFKESAWEERLTQLRDTLEKMLAEVNEILFNHKKSKRVYMAVFDSVRDILLGLIYSPFRLYTGMGKQAGHFRTGNFDDKDPNKDFKWLEGCKSKIINVSPESNVSIFPKMDYVEFLDYIKKNPTTDNSVDVVDFLNEELSNG
jgi:hypothetical protein